MNQTLNETKFTQSARGVKTSLTTPFQLYQSVGKYNTHPLTELENEFRELGKETSARHIFIGSFLTPPFIFPPLVSSDHLTNIKSWFMEMSRRDPASRTILLRTKPLLYSCVSSSLRYVIHTLSCNSAVVKHSVSATWDIWGIHKMSMAGLGFLQLCTLYNKGVFLLRCWHTEPTKMHFFQLVADF